MIEVKHLQKVYDKGRRGENKALRDVSFTLPDTGFVCLVGPSGCGKTSLLNAVGGLDTFTGGTVSTDTLSALRCGSRLTEAERNRSFGYIFQNYYLLPEYSAAYNVWLGLHSLDLSHREKLERVMEALKAVDMERFARRAVGQLSGGQQQRVAIARALARRPRVIFADEPTGNLDEANTVNICTLLRRISKTSLVVMVTHETRVARFFADRILTLEEGQLVSDDSSWDRGRLGADPSAVYTGDYEEERVEGEGVSLRLLRAEGAPPVKLTLVAEHNRILIKVDDPRAAACLRMEEVPLLVEGARPALTLEELEADSPLPRQEADPRGRAGSGLPFRVLFREAVHLLKGKGARQMGSWLFLVILTVLTLFAVGDYLQVASIDPEDFITTDSHILEVQVTRIGNDNLDLRYHIRSYTAHLAASGLDFSFVPAVSGDVTYSVSTFYQLDSEEEALMNFSHVPLSALEEEALILGRLPQSPTEIAVDRWVLEAMMERDGILQSGITDVSYFLGKTISYAHSKLQPEIVGITDCGEPALFADDTLLLSVGVAGTDVMRLSDLKAACPGQFDHLELAKNECVMITNNAGIGYTSRIGGVYTTGTMVDFTIADAVEADVYASLVVADEMVDVMLQSMMTTRFYLYCADKEAVKAYAEGGLPAELEPVIRVEVLDRHTEAWDSYREAAALRLDQRSIVTLAVILLSLVMLCLLQRSKVQERMGMAAVYRLLGIPGRKLGTIFALESLLLVLMGVVPPAALMWLAVTALSGLPSARVSLLLPWHAAAAVCAAIALFYLLAVLLPLGRLLRLPPARLAAKFDL